jgi:hypothetical protein
MADPNGLYLGNHHLFLDSSVVWWIRWLNSLENADFYQILVMADKSSFEKLQFLFNLYYPLGLYIPINCSNRHSKDQLISE